MSTASRVTALATVALLAVRVVELLDEEGALSRWVRNRYALVRTGGRTWCRVDDHVARTYRITPRRDLVEHTVGPDCVCRPRVDEVVGHDGDSWVAEEHYALDGREGDVPLDVVDRVYP